MEPQEQQPQEKINPFRESPAPQERVNPFKELPKPKQPQVKEKNKENKEKPAGREITIRLRPWKMVKGLFLIALLFGVFYLGRFSAGESTLALPSLSKFFDQDAGPSGLATGDTKAAAEAEAVKDEVPEEKTEEAQPAETEAAAPEAAEEVQEKVEEKPEKIIDEEYSKVTLSLDGVYKDWKGTWGKIKGVKYTITNNEAGTIKPHHFAMIVEGYEDGEKNFDVSYTSQKVRSGAALSDEAAVTGGFAYSPVTIPDGDLSKVRISLFLLDADSETIAAVHQEVDLSGN